jgi:hypothetical protein
VHLDRSWHLLLLSTCHTSSVCLASMHCKDTSAEVFSHSMWHPRVSALLQVLFQSSTLYLIDLRAGRRRACQLALLGCGEIWPS